MKQSAVSLVVREDTRILVVWHKTLGGWTLPGGKVDPGESMVRAQQRELEEETGIFSQRVTEVYVGPSGLKNEYEVHVFEVHAYTGGAPREMELGSPVTWMLREQFLKHAPEMYATFYLKMFGHLRRTGVWTAA